MSSIWPANLGQQGNVPAALASRILVERHLVRPPLPIIDRVQSMPTPGPQTMHQLDAVLRDALVRAEPAIIMDLRHGYIDGVQAKFGRALDLDGQPTYTAVCRPVAHGDLTVGYTNRDRLPVVSFNSEATDDGSRQELVLSFAVPDYVANPVTGDWDTADRDRWLEWVGLIPA
ncbi:hypothetical protein LG293_16060 (plasmid) [Citricoccus nitrophenolicus]